jgi:hypothetical protein
MGPPAPRSLRIRLGASVTAPLIALFIGTASVWACPQIVYNACGNNNSYCFKGYFHNGGNYTLGGPLWPEEADATISAYNPSPVWSSSATYVALDNGTPTRCSGVDCIAQIGWVHWYNCSAGQFFGSNGCNSDGLEHVFVQWTTNAGTYSSIYYYNQPTGTETYIVYRASCSGCNDAYTFYWKEGNAIPPTSVNWGPAGGEYFTEVHDADLARAMKEARCREITATKFRSHPTCITTRTARSTRQASVTPARTPTL